MNKNKLIIGLLVIASIVFLPMKCDAASRYTPKASEWLAVYINSQILGGGLDDLRAQAQVVDDGEVAIRVFYNSFVYTQADAEPIVNTAVDFGNRYIKARNFNVKITTEFHPLRITGNKSLDLRTLLEEQSK